MKINTLKSKGWKLVVQAAAIAVLLLGTNTFAASTPQKVLLLLHGINSTPHQAWDDFARNQFSKTSNMGIIRGGTLTEGTPTANKQGVLCYAIEFGYYDRTKGATGLENRTASNASPPTAGDFCDFNVLGDEINDAVSYILTKYPSAQVLLLGHSRGGLAARAFLQKAVCSKQKASVVALLSTGSPHKGSRLGRIYQWLYDHPRSNKANADDWKIVDKLSGNGFDVRRPVIKYLADNSSAMSGLNGAVGNIPTTIAVGNILYTNKKLGSLKSSIWTLGDYNVFDGARTVGIPALSVGGRTYLLGSGKTGSDFPGDGTVEKDNQRVLDLPGFPKVPKQYSYLNTGGYYHIEETGRTTHLVNGLKAVVSWGF